MNKSPVSIKMTMEIIELGNKDLTVVEEKGHLLEKDDTTVLKFSETNENNEQTDSLITIQTDKVSVKRSGAVSMLQKFQNKQITENVYRHQFGTMHMETETDQIVYQPPVANQDGKLFISYQTSLNGETPRRHRLTISLAKEN
ncbi:DUF1934 domain-containing protein [Gracilibacillus saliphilus]|uniref:DUF1934 domain-containing protein n=1 Tax=Gracilibacillus saliphilus TaxID=543890 RepID=UPI0013D88A95|nr:DUF1934 domain-containing protein [Gracilibacillus saliphilus]